MSGHSKWANIKHKKARQDIKKAKIFSKIGKEILISIKLGGSDPEGNSRLKLALQNAKSNNMPNENIKRIIQKASGKNNIKHYEELIYEGYGVAGAALIVEVMTDNKNRIAGEIRHIFDKCGGHLSESGSVEWMFCKKGKIIISEKNSDELFLKLIEFGAEDVENLENEIIVFTNVDKFYKIRKKIEELKLKINMSIITKIPLNIIKITDLFKAKQLIKMIDLLEENDDVQNTYVNFDFSDKILEQL